MAAWTERIDSFNSVGGDSRVSASHTPAANELAVVVAYATGVSGITAPTCSDSVGGTYTLVATAAKASSADKTFVFVADQLAAASARTVTVAGMGAGCTSIGLWIGGLSGMTRTGSGAVRQSGTQSNGAAAGTPTVALGGAAKSTNPLLGCVHNATNPATLTAPTGWGETSDTGGTGPVTGFECAFRDSGFGGSTVTWGSTSATAYGALAIEFDSTSVINAAASTLVWDMIAEVSKAETLKWDLATEVSASAETLKWDLAAAVTASASVLKWDLAAAVSKTLTLLADVAAEVSRSRAIVWDTRAAADADALDLLWDLRAEVARSLTLLADLRAETEADPLSIAWDLLTVGLVNAAPLSVLWDLRAAVEQDVGLEWNLRASVGAGTLALLFDLAAAVEQGLTIEWGLAVTIDRGLVLRWRYPRDRWRQRGEADHSGGGDASHWNEPTAPVRWPQHYEH